MSRLDISGKVKSISSLCSANRYQEVPTSSVMKAMPNNSRKTGDRIGASTMIATPSTNAAPNSITTA